MFEMNVLAPFLFVTFFKMWKYYEWSQVSRKLESRTKKQLSSEFKTRVIKQATDMRVYKVLTLKTCYPFTDNRWK